MANEVEVEKALSVMMGPVEEALWLMRERVLRVQLRPPAVVARGHGLVLTLYGQWGHLALTWQHWMWGWLRGLGVKGLLHKGDLREIENIWAGMMPSGG